MPDFKCGKCGLAVIVLPNKEPIRACKCPQDTAIIASLSSKVIGTSSLTTK